MLRGVTQLQRESHPMSAATLKEALASIAHVMFPADDAPREILLSTRAGDDDTPLHVFLWRENVEASLLAIAAGADPNAIGDMGETPLHVAVRKSLSEVVEALLAAGARGDIVSEFGETAEDLASRVGGRMQALFSRPCS
jgi:ankyrin repeat protein